MKILEVIQNPEFHLEEGIFLMKIGLADSLSLANNENNIFGGWFFKKLLRN